MVLFNTEVWRMFHCHILHRKLINTYLTETEGNSMFGAPIDSPGFTKHTAFPRSQSVSILL